MDSPTPDDRRARDTAALRSLTASLDDTAADLDGLVASFVGQMTDTVRSLVSVTLTLRVDNYRFAVVSRSLPDAEPIVSSVAFPLGTVTSSDLASAELVLTASRPGAFVDFAADACHILGIGLASVTVDGHLTGETTTPNSLSVSELATIDYAIGIVMERDSHVTVDDARTALIGIADRDGSSVLDTAQRIVGSAVTRRLDDQ